MWGGVVMKVIRRGKVTTTTVVYGCGACSHLGGCRVGTTV